MADMPDGLRSHVRYPLDLFEIQFATYATFHMRDPQVFYNQEDAWVVAKERYHTQELDVASYYVIMRMPDSDEEEAEGDEDGDGEGVADRDRRCSGGDGDSGKGSFGDGSVGRPPPGFGVLFRRWNGLTHNRARGDSAEGGCIGDA